MSMRSNMHHLYLDTEFNGHGGQLLSIALATPVRTGKHFYARLPDPTRWHPWVLENVVPHFSIEPDAVDVVRFRLREYLRPRQPLTIYAGWPADFGHLLDLFAGPTFDTAFCPDVRLVLLPDSTPPPECPHNALSDAIALMDWHAVNRDGSESPG